MSTSPARIAANTANARESSGPRTVEGKARSSQNARKHGLTAREVVIAPGEHEEFQQLLADFQAEIAPEGVIQQTLFNELVRASWNLRRARRIEAELCGGASYRDVIASDDLQNKLDRIARHQTRLEHTSIAASRNSKPCKRMPSSGSVFRGPSVKASFPWPLPTRLQNEPNTSTSTTRSEREPYIKFSNGLLRRIKMWP